MCFFFQICFTVQVQAKKEAKIQAEKESEIQAEKNTEIQDKNAAEIQTEKNIETHAEIPWRVGGMGVTLVLNLSVES